MCKGLSSRRDKRRRQMSSRYDNLPPSSIVRARRHFPLDMRFSFRNEIWSRNQISAHRSRQLLMRINNCQLSGKLVSVHKFAHVRK